MAWVSVSIDDLAGIITAPELAACKAAGLGAGQDDPTAAVLAQCVEEVRGYIAAASIALPADPLIPERLLRATLCIARYRIITRLPLGSNRDMIEDRRNEYEDATRLLERVASKSYAIDPADTPTAPERPSRGAYGSSVRVTF